MMLFHPRLLAPMLMTALLAGCGAAPAPDNANQNPTPITNPPERKMLSSVQFEDPLFSRCVLATGATYVDEIKQLYCGTRGRVERTTPNFFIASTRGLEQLTALEELYLTNNNITEIDVSSLKNLKVLDLSSNPIFKLDISHNPLLASLNLLNDLNYPESTPVILDASQNTKLETLKSKPIAKLLLPSTDTLKFLSLTFAAKVWSQGDAAQSTNSVSWLPDGFGLDFTPYKNLEYLMLAGPISQLKISPQNKLISLYLLNTYGLRQFSFDNAPLLQEALLRLDETATSLNIKAWPTIRRFQLIAPGITTLDVSSNSMLAHLDIGNGSLEALSGLNAVKLNTLSIGNNALTTIDLSSCATLNSLIVGSNKITDLETQNCPALTQLILGANKVQVLNLYNSPLLTNIDLRENPVVDKYLVVNQNVRNNATILNPYGISKTTVNQAAGKVPDIRLRNCLLASAREQGAVYVSDLKTLNCVGIDQKNFLVSTWEYKDQPSNTSTLTSLPLYVFDLKGLNQFSALESINLSTNWVADISELSNLQNLKQLNLDANVVQEFDLTGLESLETLDISHNPLNSLQIPYSVKSVTTAKTYGRVYSQITTPTLSDIPRLRDSETGNFLNYRDYLGIPEKNNLLMAFSLNTLNALEQ